jgi:hypothetical protein
LESELALVEAGMRQGEDRGPIAAAAPHEQVEIDGARAEAGTARAAAAEGALDRPQLQQQIERLEAGAREEGARGVEEPRLIGDRSPRLGPIEARDPDGDDEPGETAFGGGEPGGDLGLGSQVAAEADDYSFKIRSTASAKRSFDAHRVTLTNPSPLGPKPVAGVATTCASASSLAEKSIDDIPSGQPMRQ